MIAMAGCAAGIKKTCYLSTVDFLYGICSLYDSILSWWIMSMYFLFLQWNFRFGFKQMGK